MSMTATITARPVDHEAALERLWELMAHDRIERDADPAAHAAVAAGVVRGCGLPPSLQEMRRQEEQEARLYAIRGKQPPTWKPDRRILTGAQALLMRQWLSQVVDWRITTAQRRTFGDLVDPATYGDGVAWLHADGFDTVHDGELVPGLPITILVHPEGMLASVTAHRGDALGQVDIYLAADPLDTELMAYGMRLSPGSALDGVRVGRFSQDPYLSGGSLRVQLTALRAFGRPVTPWPRPLIDTWLGGEPIAGSRADFDDSTDLVATYIAATRAVVDALPADVHTMFGRIYDR